MKRDPVHWKDSPFHNGCVWVELTRNLSSKSEQHYIADLMFYGLPTQYVDITTMSCTRYYLQKFAMPETWFEFINIFKTFFEVIESGYGKDQPNFMQFMRTSIFAVHEIIYEFNAKYDPKDKSSFKVPNKIKSSNQFLKLLENQAIPEMADPLLIKVQNQIEKKRDMERI